MRAYWEQRAEWRQQTPNVVRLRIAALRYQRRPPSDREIGRRTATAASTVKLWGDRYRRTGSASSFSFATRPDGG